MEPFFEYYDVIKYGRGRFDHPQRIWSPHNTQRMTLFIKYIAILLRKSPKFMLMYFVAMHYKKHSGLFSKRQGKERGGKGGRRGPNN